MKQLPIPDYIDVTAVLDQTAAKMHASQVHGLITGLLCGNPKNHAAWEEMVCGKINQDGTHEVLKLLYDGTAGQLAEFLFEFELLLPDDDDPLPERAEALTLWCQGFLTGLKSSGVQVLEREPGEVTEALNDLVEIAKMNYEEVVASEEDEQAYAELVEYVRMAVILIFQECSQEETSDQTSSHDHLH